MNEEMTFDGADGSAVTALTSRIAMTAPAVSIASRRRIVMWHWGRLGAGAKFTFALARELRRLPLDLLVSAAEGSDLARLAAEFPSGALSTVRTFEGDKARLAGKLAAAAGVVGLPRLAADFGRSLQDFTADIAICTMQSIWDVAAIPALRRYRGRFILVLHDAVMHPGDSYPFRNSVLHQEIGAADALIVLSDHVRAEARRLHGFPDERIWTVPHGAFTFGDGAPAARRHPRPRPLRLLFFGRIVAYKGLDHLLAAYRLLQQHGVAVELEIVGSGDLAPYAGALAGLPGVHIENKWVDEAEIATALARTDLVVLPYIEASQSGVAASALAAGLPIVATPVGGLVEQVRDGVTGTVAAGMRAADLADSIQRLVDDAAFYEACSANALRHAHEALDWSQIAVKVRDIAETVAAWPKREKAP